jgi:hypothetical protein
MSNDALKLFGVECCDHVVLVLLVAKFTFVLVSLLVIGVVAINAPDDQDLELKHHCEMVQIYRESAGEFGWPDYNNTAHLCTETTHE